MARQMSSPLGATTPSVMPLATRNRATRTTSDMASSVTCRQTTISTSTASTASS